MSTMSSHHDNGCGASNNQSHIHNDHHFQQQQQCEVKKSHTTVCQENCKKPGYAWSKTTEGINAMDKQTDTASVNMFAGLMKARTLDDDDTTDIYKVIDSIDCDNSPVASAFVRHIKTTFLDVHPCTQDNHNQRITNLRNSVIEQILKPYVSTRDGSFRSALTKLRKTQLLKHGCVNMDMAEMMINAEDVAHIVWAVDSVFFGGALRAILALKKTSFCVKFGFLPMMLHDKQHENKQTSSLLCKDTHDQALGFCSRVCSTNLDFEIFINRNILLDLRPFTFLMSTIEHELVHWLTGELWPFEEMGHDKKFVHLLFLLFRHNTIYGNVEQVSTTVFSPQPAETRSIHGEQDVFWLSPARPLHYQSFQPIRLYTEQEKQEDGILDAVVVKTTNTTTTTPFTLSASSNDQDSFHHVYDSSFSMSSKMDMLSNTMQRLLTHEHFYEACIDGNVCIVERVFEMLGPDVFVFPALLNKRVCRGFGDDTGIPILLAMVHKQYEIVRFMLEKTRAALVNRNYVINFCDDIKNNDILKCNLMVAAYMISGVDMLEFILDVCIEIGTRETNTAYFLSQNNMMGRCYSGSKFGCLSYFIAANGTKTDAHARQAFELLHDKYQYDFTQDDGWTGCEHTVLQNTVQALVATNRCETLQCLHKWYQTAVEMKLQEPSTEIDHTFCCIVEAIEKNYDTMLVIVLQLSNIWASLTHNFKSFQRLVKLANDAQARDTLDVLLYVQPSMIETILQQPLACEMLTHAKSWRFSYDDTWRSYPVISLPSTSTTNAMHEMPKLYSLAWWRLRKESWTLQQKWRSELVDIASADVEKRRLQKVEEQFPALVSTCKSFASPRSPKPTVGSVIQDAMNRQELSLTIEQWASYLTPEMIANWQWACAPRAFTGFRFYGDDNKTHVFKMTPLVWACCCSFAVARIVSAAARTGASSTAAPGDSTDPDIGEDPNGIRIGVSQKCNTEDPIFDQISAPLERDAEDPNPIRMGASRKRDAVAAIPETRSIIGTTNSESQSFLSEASSSSSSMDMTDYSTEQTEDDSYPRQMNQHMDQHQHDQHQYYNIKITFRKKKKNKRK